MERIKMKFIIAVTGKLSAAADCDAKTDLIEELSENLYERYLEYTASGMTEEDAYQKTLEELGDVDELLSYLGANRSNSDWQASLGQNINELCRDAMNAAQNAVKESKNFLKDLGGKLKEKYPDGFRGHIHVNIGEDEFWEHYDEDEDEDEDRLAANLDADQVHHIAIRLLNSDLMIRIGDDSTEQIRIFSEDVKLETAVFPGEDGMLTVREVKQKGIRSNGKVELVLPPRHWESFQVMGGSSDVTVEGVLDAGQVNFQVAGGDVRFGSDGESSGVTGAVQLETASGDVELDGDYAAVTVKTASGDIRAAVVCPELALQSASGDVHVESTTGKLLCHTVSGDLDLTLEELPTEITVSTTSGDCRLYLPEHEGFSIRYKTLSGDFGTNFKLTGTKGERVYLDGGNTNIAASTVSGDIIVRRKE